jgi:hypothetical protein
MLVRFIFQSSTYTVQAGSVPNVTACTLLVEGDYLPRAVMDQKLALYSKTPLYLSYLDMQRQQTAQLGMAASTTYTINLTAISGLVAYMWIGLRPNAQSSTNQYTFSTTSNLASIDVQDANGQSIIGYYQRTPVPEISVYGYPQELHNQFNLNVGAIMLKFCESPVTSFTYGSNSGSNVFTGYEKIVLTTNASFSTADTQVCIYARTYNNILVEGGELKRLN